VTSNRRSLWLVGLLLACGSARGEARFPHSPHLVLQGSDGRTHDVTAEIARAKLTVFVFYSESCPCMRVHEPRLETIRRDYGPRGVALVLVDSEVNADAARDAEVAALRRYSFPLLTDPGARLAKAMQAEFATHSVVVDTQGRVRYSGGIDSDENHLHDDATPYLRDALDDLLSDRAPRNLGSEALGCTLQTN
jgi:Redoxin